jgi:hypothetical protein
MCNKNAEILNNGDGLKVIKLKEVKSFLENGSVDVYPLLRTKKQL